MEKIYLYPFIICTILSQGIFGTSLKDDIGESSDLLVRNKRVINRIPGQDVASPIQHFRYVARIRKNNRVVCAGAILSHHTVITAARCIPQNELHLFNVGAGSGTTHLGKTYNIIRIENHDHQPGRSFTFETGVSLITVEPPIVYTGYIKNINLHDGPILTGMQATVSGWGTFYTGGTVQTQHPRNLRSITVPIISHRECVNSYLHFFNITEEDICTYHEDKQCGVTDAGAPLVIDNLLVGIYLGVVSVVIRDCHTKPDVFALIQHRAYNQWIRANIVY